MNKQCCNIITASAFFALICTNIWAMTAPFDSLLSKGEQLLKHNNADSAVTYLEAAIKLNPDNAEAHYFLGYAFDRQPSKVNSKLKWTGRWNPPDVQRQNRSTDELKTAIKLSPKYTGKLYILDPYTKITSNWGSLASSYVSFGKLDSAKWCFEQGRKDGGFFPALLEFNRNMLASCDKDAIIFTNGDMDTYPGWYLQLMEGFRKDITIINLSLLNTEWFIKLIKQGKFINSTPVDIKLTDSEIDSLNPKSWKEQTVELPLPPDVKGIKQFVRWVVKPTVEDKAIRVQDEMILQILKDNNWKRPVYFAVTVSNDNTIGLISNYLKWEGLVKKVVPQKCDPNDRNSTCSFGQIAKNLNEVYQYSALHAPDADYSADIGRMTANYQSLYLQLVSYYKSTGEKTKALAALKAMNEKIPPEKFPLIAQVKKQVDEMMIELEK